MNILAPISTIMTTEVITVTPKDKLQIVQDIFEEYRIHHLPVVDEGKVVGMLSNSDLMYFLKGKSYDKYEEHLNKVRLKNYTVEEIMTCGIATLKSSDLIRTALNIFKENLFHALPVIDDGKLVGIISSQDIIISLANQKAIT